MGGTESSLKVIMQFSKIPEPVQVPQDNSNLREMLTEVKKAITENGSEGVALFINTYRNSMKILLQIMKHPNSQPETVMLGFDIVNILFEYDSALAAFLQYQGIEFLQKICTTYDFKTEGRVRKMSAAINLIIKIIKRDIKIYIKAAETIVSKGIISILTPLIMETEVQQSDTERIELIRSTAKVFAELTEIQNLDILKKMANETGIVANFVLLLNDFEDGPTLGYSLNTLGNLSILPNVQGNQFLIKNGVQNVLQIFELLNKKHRMGILSKLQRDIIQGDIENNQLHHLAQYTIDIIKINKQQWGLHILEILTFISRKLVRKGFNTLNQFQLHLTKLQYVTENKDDQVQLWTQQLFQMLRLVSINNKIIKLQTMTDQTITSIPAPPLNKRNKSHPPPTSDRYLIRDAQHQKELEEFEKQFREYENNFNDHNRNSRLITKKVIYSEDQEEWSSVEEAQEYDAYDKDESEKDDSSQHTYYIDSQSELSELTRNHYRKLCDDAGVKYVIGNRGYQIEKQQIKDLPQQLLLNSNDQNLNYNQQVNTIKDMQTITKAQLINRFDTRESCISIWLNTINSDNYKQIKKLAQATNAMFVDLTKGTLLSWLNKSDAELKAEIKEKMNTMEETSPTTVKFIQLLTTILIKNVTANEHSCVSITADYQDHINRVEIYVKCLQKHTYFIKSDLTQLITTRCKELIATKELKFSINIKHFDTFFKFKDMGDTVQILHTRPKKGRKRVNKRNMRGKGKNKGGKRRNNRRRRNSVYRRESPTQLQASPLFALKSKRDRGSPETSILEEKEDKWIRLQACKTLRQLAATRNPELALKIKNLQTIDKLLKIIDQDQEEESGVNFYCKLSLLELCHSKENQEEIEQKGDHLLSLTYYQPKTTQERVLFANTILQFSYRSSWIKIPEVFPYFVRVVMKNLKESLTIKHKKNADTKKSFIERKSVSKIQKLSLKAQKNTYQRI